MQIISHIWKNKSFCTFNKRLSVTVLLMSSLTMQIFFFKKQVRQEKKCIKTKECLARTPFLVFEKKNEKFHQDGSPQDCHSFLLREFLRFSHKQKVNPIFLVKTKGASHITFKSIFTSLAREEYYNNVQFSFHLLMMIRNESGVKIFLTLFSKWSLLSSPCQLPFLCL